jgi:hypothetical protein
MNATDIVGYTYQADIYCRRCIVRQLPNDVTTPAALDMDSEDVLEQVSHYVGVDRMDEHSYDSDVFPKVVFCSQLEAGETCGGCGDEF